MNQLGRQFGKVLKRTLGRQLPQSTQRLGRQLSTSLKLMPQAFKDTSKAYSQIEKATRAAGVPVVPEVFKFASSGTGAIGNLLSGDVGSAISGGRQAVQEGGEAMAAMAPYFV